MKALLTALACGVVFLLWTVPSAFACQPPPSKTVTLFAENVPECLTLQQGNGYGSGAPLGTTNGCGEPVTLTCVAGCGEWSEPTVVAAGDSNTTLITGSMSVDWEVDGQSGRLELGLKELAPSHDCAELMNGCAAGTSETPIPWLPVGLLLVVLAWRRRASPRSVHP